MYREESVELENVMCRYADILGGERREGGKTASKRPTEPILEIHPNNKMLKTIEFNRGCDWVGTVGLKAKQDRPGIQIRIEAKFPDVYQSIWTMMATLRQRDPIQEGECRTRGNSEGNLWEMYLLLLGEHFRKTLETLNRVGLGQVNVKKHIRCTDMRGPIDLTQLSLDCLYAGFPIFVYTLSEDNAVNCILKYALIRLLEVFNRIDEHGRALLRDVKSHLEMLQKKMFTNVATSNLAKYSPGKDQLGIIPDICTGE